MCSKSVIRLLHAFSDRHQIDTCEDHDTGGRLREPEDSKSCSDADQTGYDWLDIIVHGDHRRPELLLCIHRHDIGNESAHEDNKERFAPSQERNVAPWQSGNMLCCERDDHDNRPKHHPLHAGHDPMTGYESFEEGQIECIAALGTDHQQISANVARTTFGRSGTSHDEDERSRYTQQDTEQFDPCDAFVEYDCRQDERDDRHRGGHDAGIGGRGDAESDGEAALVGDDTKQSCARKE